MKIMKDWLDDTISCWLNRRKSEKPVSWNWNWEKTNCEWGEGGYLHLTTVYPGGEGVTYHDKITKTCLINKFNILKKSDIINIIMK